MESLIPDNKQQRLGLIVAILSLLVIISALVGSYYSITRFAMIDDHESAIQSGVSERAALHRRVSLTEAEQRESRLVMQEVRILLGRIEERLPEKK